MAMVGSITRGEVMGTPGTKIDWQTEDTKAEGVGSNTEPASQEEERVGDYTEIIKDSAFLGDTPIEAIIDGLTTQFNDYINIDDKTNYLDVYYTQMHNSREAVRTNVDETHPAEIMEALDDIQSRFITKICDLFKERLTISFMDIESESTDYDDLEFVLRRMYEFFILGARNNFKTVIASDVLPKISGIKDDREYFNRVQELVASYSPLILSMGPMDFLNYRHDTEIVEMFENGKVVGNFLRKYSPKFYQNEEFMVEVINHITMIDQFKTDLVESVSEFDKSNVSPNVKTLVEKTTKDYLAMIREPVCEMDGDGSPAVSSKEDVSENM